MQINLEVKRKGGCIPHPIILKPCAWCKEIIPRLNKSPAQYDRIQVHKHCASFWAHYKSSKDKLPIRVDVPCAHCGKVMNRRPKELLQSWAKRMYCDKSCAATAVNKKKQYKIKTNPKAEEARLGLIRYVPGTEAFERLAQQYLERGF